MKKTNKMISFFPYVAFFLSGMATQHTINNYFDNRPVIIYEEKSFPLEMPQNIKGKTEGILRTVITLDKKLIDDYTPERDTNAVYSLDTGKRIN